MLAGYFLVLNRRSVRALFFSRLTEELENLTRVSVVVIFLHGGFPMSLVCGIGHTTLENVWSLFKRSIIGSYHQVSVKHLDRYLDEFEFRFKNRENPYLFRDTLPRLLQTSNLEYKELTSDKAM